MQQLVRNVSEHASPPVRRGLVRLFLFQTCIGSGPEAPPFLNPEPDDLGVEACWPLADLATSRGRATEGVLLLVVAVALEATWVSIVPLALDLAE